MATGGVRWLLRAEGAVLPAAAIWFAHIGPNRALGHGLRYRTAWRDTHLGPMRQRAVR